jgi:cation diffusion facilitator family transporter
MASFDRSRLTRYAWLSIATAVATILLKITAYLLTGSVGLLSDALESSVNLVAGVVALIVLTIAARPPDEEHAYGHDKAEYFASGVEGTLILLAAGTIGYTAVTRLFNPQPLEQVGLGLLITGVASLLNLVVARVLLQAGRQYRSVTLEADARHLLTDVWTSVGVIVGVAAVWLTGWTILDPLVALAVAAHILYWAFTLLRQSANGLMDAALPPEEIAQAEAILRRVLPEGTTYHALRTRQSGAQRFISVHIQAPGDWTVQRGHTLLEEVEMTLIREMAPVSIITHIEPLEDPASWEDIALQRQVGREE